MIIAYVVRPVGLYPRISDFIQYFLKEACIHCGIKFIAQPLYSGKVINIAFDDILIFIENSNSLYLLMKLL